MMISLTAPENLDAAVYAINLHLLGSDDWLLVCTGHPDRPLAPGCFEFSSSFNKLIFSFWDDDSSQSWRVTDYQIKSNRLKMRVERQMGQVKALFEIRPAAESKDDERVSLSIRERRRQFEGDLCALVEAEIFGAHIDRSITRRDVWRQLSGIYTRLIIDRRGQKIAGIGVNAGENQTSVDALLGAGIVWFRRASATLRERPLSKLLLFVPHDKGTLIAERLTAIRSAYPIELYEYDEAMQALTPGSSIRPGRFGADIVAKLLLV